MSVSDTADDAFFAMGDWCSQSAPFSRAIATLTAALRSAIQSDDTEGTLRLAQQLRRQVDETEQAVPAPPDPQAEVHWNRALVLQRRMSEEAIRAVTVTHDLQPSSQLAFAEAKELEALANIINAWADRYEALGRTRSTNS